MRRHPPDDLTPWSLVVPVALAVMVGILAADLVRLGVGALVVKSAIDAVGRSASSANVSGRRPAAPGTVAAHAGSAHREPQPDVSVPALPGPTTAVREGLGRACIGGTIALRRDNGWSQETSAGRPLRCSADSP